MSAMGSVCGGESQEMKFEGRRRETRALQSTTLGGFFKS